MNKKILGNFKFTYTFDERQDLKKTIAQWNTNGTRKHYKEMEEKVAEFKKHE